jgi:hypothetical protein
MTWALSIPRDTVALATRAPHRVSHGSRLVRELVERCGALFDGYRPERHYMRGPGPKWRAKHGGAAGRVGPAASPGKPRAEASHDGRSLWTHVI